MRVFGLALVLIGCQSTIEFPDPDDWESAGPGGPGRSFESSELFQSCATLSGGEEDAQEHNLVGMVDGYLVLPWAPETAGGGLSLFDFSDPCAPVEVGKAVLPMMRETHTLAVGRTNGRRYLAVDSMDPEDHTAGGIGFVDITDPQNPVWAGHLVLPGFKYPDAYFFVSLSAFWLGDVLYVPMGFLGVAVVDVSDPTQPVHLSTIPADTLLTGSFHVIGTRAMLSNAGMSLTRIYDVSDPLEPRPLAGGEFEILDEEGGRPIPYYFANMGGKYALFARKGDGGGPVVYDLSDPAEPAFVSHLHQEEAAGGYIFRHHNYLFQGEGDFGALYEFSNPTQPTEIGRFHLPGDLDTVTPVGNVAVVSVDHGARDGVSSVVVPWQSEVDTQEPTAELSFPMDGETNVALTAAIGVSFDEAVLDVSVFAGSFRVWTHRQEPVAGRYFVQEGIVNFVPDLPFPEDTTIHVKLPVEGVSDLSGNPLKQSLEFSFSTGEVLK